METRHSNTHLFIYGMRDTSGFVLKGDAPLVTRVFLYLHNQIYVIGMCVSLLLQKWTCFRY
jgi:hypothetical protein